MTFDAEHKVKWVPGTTKKQQRQALAGRLAKAKHDRLCRWERDAACACAPAAVLSIRLVREREKAAFACAPAAVQSMRRTPSLALPLPFCL